VCVDILSPWGPRGRASAAWAEGNGSVGLGGPSLDSGGSCLNSHEILCGDGVVVGDGLDP
jgi:hypothetical protein